MKRILFWTITTLLSAFIATSSQASTIDVSFESYFQNFTNVFPYLYPDSTYNPGYVEGLIVFDPNTSQANATIDTWGFWETYTGTAFVADTSGVYVDPLLPAGSEFISGYGVIFDGVNSDGSSLHFNINTASDVNSGFYSPGTMHSCPLGYCDAADTFGGTAALSFVPLPASLPMFGAAVFALGALGCGLKLRKALVAG